MAEDVEISTKVREGGSWDLLTCSVLKSNIRVQLHSHKTDCLSLKIYKLQDSEFKKAKLKTSPRGNFEKRGTLLKMSQF